MFFAVIQIHETAAHIHGIARVVNSAVGAYKHAYFFRLIEICRACRLHAVNLNLARLGSDIVVEIYGVDVNAAILQRADYLYDVIRSNRFRTVGYYDYALNDVFVEKVAGIAKRRANIGRCSVDINIHGNVGNYFTQNG